MYLLMRLARFSFRRSSRGAALTDGALHQLHGFTSSHHLIAASRHIADTQNIRVAGTMPRCDSCNRWRTAVAKVPARSVRTSCMSVSTPVYRSFYSSFLSKNSPRSKRNALTIRATMNGVIIPMKNMTIPVKTISITANPESILVESSCAICSITHDLSCGGVPCLRQIKSLCLLYLTQCSASFLSYSHRLCGVLRP